MTIKRVFKNTMAGTQYLFKNGKSAAFTNGRYETDIDWEIAELDEEIRNGIPHIYVDPKDTTVDTGQIDFVRQRQIEATKQALKDYEAAKNGTSEAPVANQVPASVISGTDTNGTVEGDGYQKDQFGTLEKPGANEAQRVQVDRNDVPVPPVGAAKEVPVGDNKVEVVPAKAPTVNMAKILANRTPTPNTGIASSANTGDASGQSAS